METTPRENTLYSLRRLFTMNIIEGFYEFDILEWMQALTVLIELLESNVLGTRILT